MVGGIKENQRPEMPAGAEPDITPEMVQSVFTVLESEGLIHHMKGGAYVPTEGGWKLLREAVEGKEVITAYGHVGIIARDDNCFEITTNEDPKGEDSVIAVRADKALVRP
jgi:predicted transcriptional regulator